MMKNEKLEGGGILNKRLVSMHQLYETIQNLGKMGSMHTSLISELSINGNSMYCFPKALCQKAGKNAADLITTLDD